MAFDLQKFTTDSPGEVIFPNGASFPYVSWYGWGMRKRKDFQKRWGQARDLYGKEELSEAEEAEYDALLLGLATEAITDLDADQFNALPYDFRHLVVLDFLIASNAQTNTNVEAMRDHFPTPDVETDGDSSIPDSTPVTAATGPEAG